MQRTTWIDLARDEAFFALIDTVDQMQDAMRVIAMGVDYQRYARFRMLVPVVWHRSGGRPSGEPGERGRCAIPYQRASSM
jgi:hypothetical protein